MISNTSSSLRTFQIKIADDAELGTVRVTYRKGTADWEVSRLAKGFCSTLTRL